MHPGNPEDNNIKATTLPKFLGWVVALILVVVGTSTSGMMHYHHTDGLGSIRVMDDYQGFGYAAYTYNYDAYGNRTCSSCPQYNPFGYTGQYTDDESGMLYLRARYYDPTTQQFISRDSASASGGSEQPYTYAGGNPVNFVDPTGNWPSGPEEQIPSEGGVRAQSNGTWVQQSMPGLGDMFRGVGQGVNGSLEGGLLANEGRVGTFKYLDKKVGSINDDLTPHHIPSDDYMAKTTPLYSSEEGIAMMMEMPVPGTGGRHRRTFSYGRSPDLSINHRTALARDVMDARSVYMQDGTYTPEIRQGLQEVIRQNKGAMPLYFGRAR